MILVTGNAVERYLQRIGAPDWDSAKAEIAAAERGIEAAARFGASIVRTHRARLVLQGTHVVDVLPRDWIPNSDLRMAELAERRRDHAERPRPWLRNVH